ncbi:hypothetical protein D9619_002544 [Psilocybe cf. subviscida]|uniref:Tyrosine specific protein phosphatases domain-containing protein n=1 Tax=Psilocybe cf. subviscida TaxID=2480587 RepID=A0A8H5EUI2_9AGAR|nr:hypothetical protein D9619_002544 [Psilocybe cf. subviscida]
MATLQTHAGGYALVGPTVDAMAYDILQRNRTLPVKPESTYHITVITKAEMKNLTEARVQSIHADTRHIFSVGVGGKANGGVYWIVIIWAAGQQLRKQLGLPPKYFHITLSSTDIHEVDKGIGSLLTGQPLPLESVEFLDHTAFTLQCFAQFYEAQEYSARLITLDPAIHKGFLRLADAVLAEGLHKTAMLAYACAYERSTEEKLKAYCTKKLVECSHFTEWGPVMQQHETAQLERFDGVVCALLLRAWPPGLKEHISDLELSASLPIESRQPLYIPSPKGISGRDAFYKLPRFFRWLVPYHLAIMSTPRNEDDITALASTHLGIRHVLTLTEEEPLKEQWFARNPNIRNTFLPVPNYKPPSIEQVDLIMRLFDDARNLPLLVHCGGGKGRAGTVAACYLAAYGFRKPVPGQDHPELAAAEAIARLRTLRPGSLETAHQEDFVAKWCSTIWKRQSIYPDLPSEPLPSPMVVEGTLSDKNDLFILVGLPGSGKSFFAKSLLARDPTKWVYISQDDTGSRSICENAIGRAPAKGNRVILDRCNTSAADRKLWLQLASNWCTSPVCVLFDYDKELCVSRAQMRSGHPTLPPGSRVRNAVAQMHGVFQKPSLVDEGFQAVVTVRSFAAAQGAVDRVSGGPLGICKFPRTPHLLDLGAAAPDDVHLELEAFAQVNTARWSASAPGFPSTSATTIVVTEKVDGANMGLSLSPDRSRIIVQNRSHFVNPASHEQFKKLGMWVERHEEELRRVLDRDPYFAERYILYGEWLAVTHSIAYTRLPDRFVAFDLYDRSLKRWLGTRVLRALLNADQEATEGNAREQGDSIIKMVPTIYEGAEMPTQEVLLEMIQSQSAFYDGRVEGVYVKVEADGWVRARGKVVRSDFIAGNEHWTKGNLRVNMLAAELYS